MIARLWQTLTTLNLTRRRVKSKPGATGQPEYAMWLERDRDRWDWLDADLYHRWRGGPR